MRLQRDVTLITRKTSAAIAHRASRVSTDSIATTCIVAMKNRCRCRGWHPHCVVIKGARRLRTPDQQRALCTISCFVFCNYLRPKLFSFKRKRGARNPVAWRHGVLVLPRRLWSQRTNKFNGWHNVHALRCLIRTGRYGQREQDTNTHTHTQTQTRSKVQILTHRITTAQLQQHASRNCEVER